MTRLQSSTSREWARERLGWMGRASGAIGQLMYHLRMAVTLGATTTELTAGVNAWTISETVTITLVWFYILSCLSYWNSYHVPRSFVQQSSNTVVLFEEMGGDPTQVSFVARQTGSLCAHVSESHPGPIDAWVLSRGKPGPRVHLECQYPNQVISPVNFASFGTPSGMCGSFQPRRMQ